MLEDALLFDDDETYFTCHFVRVDERVPLYSSNGQRVQSQRGVCDGEIAQPWFPW